MARSLIAGPGRWPVAVAALLPLILWLLLSDARAFSISRDTGRFVRAGAAFWQTGRYVQPGRSGLEPEMARTPVYSLVVGLFVWSGELHIDSVVAMQIALRVSIVLLILTLPIAGRIGSLDWRVAVAWFVALDLLSALMALQVLTETLSAALLVLTLWCWLRAQRRPGWFWVAGAGLSAGLASVTRPLNLAVLPLLLIWSFVATTGPATMPRAMRLTLLVSMLLLPTLWVARNYAESGRWIFSLTWSHTLYDYRAVGIVSAREGRSLSDVRHDFDTRLEEAIANGHLTSWEAADWERRQAWPIIRSAPRTLLAQAGAGLWRSLVGPGVELWRIWHAASVLAASATVPLLLTGATLLPLAGLYAAALLGVFRRSWRSDPGVAIACWTGFAILLAIAAGPESYSRFRVPVMPLAALGAAWFWREPVGTEGDA